MIHVVGGLADCKTLRFWECKKIRREPWNHEESEITTTAKKMPDRRIVGDTTANHARA